MNTKRSVLIVSVCFLTLFTLSDCITCMKHVLEGNTTSFKLTEGTLGDKERFTIKRDNKIIVPKRNKNEMGFGIVENGFLKILNMNLSDEGNYTVETFSSNGKMIYTKLEIVCVYAKVPKPTVNITCHDEKIKLRCDVEGKKLSYDWQKNNKSINKKEKNLENIEPENVKYSCSARNPVHQTQSDAVKAECSTTIMLFGFEYWTMVGILAGGGTCVLLLMILMVTLSCRSCKRRKKHQQDEEEYRLNYVNASQHPQKSKQTARGQPAPPEPVNNGSTHDVDQRPCQTAPPTRNQPRARPPPPPLDEFEEEPPPLPQPRKKTKKHEGPL